MKEQRINGVDWECPAGLQWDLHRAETKKAMEQVNAMFNTISQIHGDTQHLTQLPHITGALKANVEVLEDIRDKLVGKATEQDPRLIKIFLICMGVLGISMIVLMAYFTKFNMHISPSEGLKFDGQPR